MSVEPTAISVRDSSRTGVRELPVALWLSVIVVVSTAIRAALAYAISVPAIYPDELVYWELSRGIGESGKLAMRDEAVSAWTYGPLYPLVIAPVHVVTGSLVDAYTAVKVINALLFSLAAVPAYFLARRLLSVRCSLLAAALAVLVPSAIYTTRIMAESLCYPLFLCAVLAMMAALERPSRRHQLLALTMIALAALTRSQMAVLLPAFWAAIALTARTERRAPASFRLTWWASGLVVLAAAALGVTSSLGAHTEVVHDLDLIYAPAKALWHIAVLDLYAGVIPFAAFVLVLWSALTGASRKPELTRFAAVSGSTAVTLILLAGVYTTAFAHVFDRYVFYLVPLFAIALLAWVEDESAGRRRVVVGVAATAALLPLTLPFESLLNEREWGTSTSSIGLVPVVWLKALVGEGLGLRAIVLVLTSALALAFLRSAKRWSVARAASYLLVLFSVMTSMSNWALSENARDEGVTEQTWVDIAVAPNSDVAVLWHGDRRHPPAHRTALRQTEFFNRVVGPVFDLRHPLAGGVPSTRVTVERGGVVDAAGHPIRSQYVIAHRSLDLRGRPVARDSGSGLALYRVDGQVRVGRR